MSYESSLKFNDSMIESWSTLFESVESFLTKIMEGDQLSMMMAMEKEREQVIQIFEEVQNIALSKIETVPFNQIVEQEQIAMLRLPASNTSNQYR